MVLVSYLVFDWCIVKPPDSAELTRKRMSEKDKAQECQVVDVEGGNRRIQAKQVSE